VTGAERRPASWACPTPVAAPPACQRPSFTPSRCVEAGIPIPFEQVKVSDLENEVLRLSLCVAMDQTVLMPQTSERKNEHAFVFLIITPLTLQYF
jgi:hypothetical protein